MDETTAAQFGLEPTGVASGLGSGHYGFSQHFTMGDVSLSGAIQSMWSWLNEPFAKPLSPVGLTLIVGAILVAVILWNFILYHIRIAAEAL